MPDNTITEIEKRLDDDYKQCFPQSTSWEKSATHLLIAYDFAVRGSDVRTVDRLKFALMHVLRWGRDVPSQSFCGYPNDFDPELFERCRASLQRGGEYVGIWGAFTLYHNESVDIERLDESQIEFTENPSWKAYDILDSQLSWPGKPSLCPSSIAAFQNTARQLANGFRNLTPQEMTDWFPDFGTCRDLLPSAGKLLKEGLLLPRSWSFDGIPILSLRAFWKALITLAMIHLGVVHRLTGEERVRMIQLLVKPQNALIDWIAGCVGIDEQVVARLIDLHIYDHASNPPDIAIAPFLRLGNGRLAASPWMLTSSSWERNFCANAARVCPKLYSPTDRLLARHLGEELVGVFKKAGFEADHSLKFKRDSVKGDIDLLVWSPTESYVMAFELYWKIPTADVMEVLHGENTCLQKIEEQLPKYHQVLSAEAGELLARTFKLKSRPVVKDWSCGLAARGFVGTPRLGNEQFFFVPEILLNKEVVKHRSLTGLCKWIRSKQYVPQENRDFTMRPVEVTSPSGMHVKFWESSPP